MKKQIILIKIAGFFTGFFSIFHLQLFYWLFNWKDSLRCLNSDNWAIFHTFNYGVNMMFILFTIISLFMTKKLLTETIGTVMLVFMSSIFVMRIVSEFILWKFTLGKSPIIIIYCIIPAILYVLPLFSKPKNKIF
jgi:hypothetical protein